MAEAIVTVKLTPTEHRTLVAALTKQAELEEQLGERTSSLTPSERRNAHEREAQLRFLLGRL